MDELLRYGLCNAAWAAALALLAAVGARICRRWPAVSHALWLLVLLKLVVPSVFSLSLPDRAATPSEPPPLAPLDVASAPVTPAVFIQERPISEPAAAPLQTAPPATVGAPSLPLRWQTLVLALWLAGAGTWWTMLVWNLVRFRRLMRFARPAEPQLRERIGQVAGRMGLRSCPAAWLLPARLPPMLWVPLAGSPRLVLPEVLWNQLDPAQQDAILAHELAHLKRRDHWVRRLQAIVCGLYWWDPIAWLARREVERAEEQCCDAWVLRALPNVASAYAESLVATAAFLAGLRTSLPLGASGVGRLIPLQRRLQMIMSNDRGRAVAGSIPRILLICGALSLLFLPALASSPRQSQGSADPALKSQDSPRDERSNARTTQAQTRQNPAQAHTAEQRKDADPGGTSIPLKVRVAHPIEREVSDYEMLPGRIEAGREVELKSRVSGTVIAVHCRPGQAVKADETLFEIDPRSYKAELDKAQAEYERAEAHRARFASDLKGAKKLADGHTISQEELNRHEGDFQEAEASLKAAAAVRDLARLNLEFTRVTAPFAGTITGTVLAAGNVADADRTSLASLIAVDPLYVSFNVPQNVVLNLNRLRREGKFRGEVPISLVLPEGPSRPAKLEFADIRIDPNAGTARWRAVIANPDQFLLPGMFAHVRLTTSAPYKHLLVTPGSILSSPGPSYVVYVVHGDVAETRQVFPLMDAMHNGLVSVMGGIKPDDWVIIDRFARLRNGMKVVPERVPMPIGTSSGRPPLGIQ